MPNASLHITLGIWSSRIGRRCTKWYWCSWQNKLQWLLNHMNYLSLWLVSHRLQTNVLLWLPLLRQKSSGLPDRTVTEQWVPAQPPRVPQGPVPRGCPWLCPLQLGGDSDLGQVRGRIALRCNLRCAKGCTSRQPQLLGGQTGKNILA